MVDYSCPNLDYDSNMGYNFPCALHTQFNLFCSEEDYLKCSIYLESRLLEKDIINLENE